MPKTFSKCCKFLLLVISTYLHLFAFSDGSMWDMVLGYKKASNC